VAALLLVANAYFAKVREASAQADSALAVAAPVAIDAPFAPAALRPLSPLEAEQWNREVPQVATITAARPFAIASSDAQSFSRSLQCMTAAVYYEAANEPLDGQRAVAQVILNRMRSPIYPHSVCGVVYQGAERRTGCQFTFTCDGSLARTPSAASWARATAVAATALGGYVYAPVGWATHYHADYVVPYWAQSLDKLTTIGRHIFYGWKGAAGTGTGFTSRYAGAEPEIGVPGPLNVAQAAATGEAPAGIVEVTSAERPVIALHAGDAALGAAKPANKTSVSEAGHSDIAASARWVIGGPAAPAHSTQTAVAMAARKPIPADPERGAKGAAAAE
jgi:spore germination cell wall hydrolase CwlJ-like protein